MKQLSYGIGMGYTDFICCNANKASLDPSRGKSMFSAVSGCVGEDPVKVASVPYFRCSSSISASVWPFKICKTCQRLENEAKNGPGISRIEVQYRLTMTRTQMAPIRRTNNQGFQPWRSPVECIIKVEICVLLRKEVQRLVFDVFRPRGGLGDIVSRVSKVPPLDSGYSPIMPSWHRKAQRPLNTSSSDGYRVKNLCRLFMFTISHFYI